MDPFILSIIGIAILAGVLLGIISLVFFLIRRSRDRKDAGDN
jgi:hypothetical protein